MAVNAPHDNIHQKIARSRSVEILYLLHLFWLLIQCGHVTLLQLEVMNRARAGHHHKLWISLTC